MKKPAVLVTCVTLVMASLSGAAEVYRWTDENGRVHFSDKPPRDREAENITERSKPTNIDESGAEREKLKALFAPETPEEKQFREQREAERLAARAEQRRRCDEARRELHILENERFYWVDEDGNGHNASKSERQQAVEQLTAAIERHCQ